LLHAGEVFAYLFGQVFDGFVGHPDVTGSLNDGNIGPGLHNPGGDSIIQVELEKRCADGQNLGGGCRQEGQLRVFGQHNIAGGHVPELDGGFAEARVVKHGGEVGKVGFAIRFFEGECDRFSVDKLWRWIVIEPVFIGHNHTGHRSCYHCYGGHCGRHPPFCVFHLL
jgi:hypothetical protein